MELGAGPAATGVTGLRRTSKNGKEEEDVAAVLQQLSEGSGGPDGEAGGVARGLHGVSRLPGRYQLDTSLADHTRLQTPPIPSNGPNGLASVGFPELDALLALIPSRPVCDYLLESFVLRADWWLHVSSSFGLSRLKRSKLNYRFPPRSCTCPPSTTTIGHSGTLSDPVADKSTHNGQTGWHSDSVLSSW